MKLLLVVLLALAANAQAGELPPRNKAQINLFKRTHICPSTGTTLKSRQSCKGHVIDHIRPRCKGGADVAANMQYQTIAAAKAKDKVECR